MPSDSILVDALRLALVLCRDPVPGRRSDCGALSKAAQHYGLNLFDLLDTDPRLAELARLVDEGVAGEPKRAAIRDAIARLTGIAHLETAGLN